jgi:hypothetical protein
MNALLVIVEVLLQLLALLVVLSEEDTKELKVLNRFNSTFEVECGDFVKKLVNRFILF